MHEVGKTHLIRFLSDGTIPEKYLQTMKPENKSGRRFKLSDLDLKIKDLRDTPGHDRVYSDWEQEVSKADVVLYLLRVDWLKSGKKDTENRVRKDLKIIRDWLNLRKPIPKVFIIGTHCDKDPEYPGDDPSSLGPYIEKFLKLKIMWDSVTQAGGSDRVRVVVGSMKDAPNTERLVYQLFSVVQSWK